MTIRVGICHRKKTPKPVLRLSMSKQHLDRAKMWPEGTRLKATLSKQPLSSTWILKFEIDTQSKGRNYQGSNALYFNKSGDKLYLAWEQQMGYDNNLVDLPKMRTVDADGESGIKLNRMDETGISFTVPDELMNKGRGQNGWVLSGDKTQGGRGTYFTGSTQRIMLTPPVQRELNFSDADVKQKVADAKHCVAMLNDILSELQSMGCSGKVSQLSSGGSVAVQITRTTTETL